MKTVLIQVDKLTKVGSHGYPVRIFFDDGTKVEWDSQEIGSDLIPKSLAEPPPLVIFRLL